MISCTEFIPAYNELFRYLHDKGGKEAVVTFWQHLSDAFLDNLRDLAIRKGLAGCYEYWSQTLTEEAADFRMTLEKNETIFKIEMRYCPSKGRLLETDHIRNYEHYCEHCDVLYRRVLEPLGYDYNVDLSKSDQAKCVLTIRDKSSDAKTT